MICSRPLEVVPLAALFLAAICRYICHTMASPSDFPARGKLKEANGDHVIFQPAGTTYEIYLGVNGQPITGPIGEPIEALIRVRGRKVLTVPSGGNFIAPIYGPPRICQGRVRYVDERCMVVHCGVNIVIELPKEDSALDLAVGPVTLNGMINATVFPGAVLELQGRAALI